MFKLVVIALVCAALALSAEAILERELPAGRMPLDSASQGIDNQTGGAVPEGDLRGEHQTKLGDNKMPLEGRQRLDSQPQLNDQHGQVDEVDESCSETDTVDLEEQGGTGKDGSYRLNSDAVQIDYLREHDSGLGRTQQEHLHQEAQTPGRSQQPQPRPQSRIPYEDIDFNGLF